MNSENITDNKVDEERYLLIIFKIKNSHFLNNRKQTKLNIEHKKLFDIDEKIIDDDIMRNNDRIILSKFMKKLGFIEKYIDFYNVYNIQTKEIDNLVSEDKIINDLLINSNLECEKIENNNDGNIEYLDNSKELINYTINNDRNMINENSELINDEILNLEKYFNSYKHSYKEKFLEVIKCYLSKNLNLDDNRDITNNSENSSVFVNSKFLFFIGHGNVDIKTGNSYFLLLSDCSFLNTRKFDNENFDINLIKPKDLFLEYFNIEIFYEDIANIWIEICNSNRISNQKKDITKNLYIIADFSSAGGWIGEHVKHNHILYNINIISSCSKKENAYDIPSVGSLLIQNLISNKFNYFEENEKQIFKNYNNLFKYNDVKFISNGKNNTNNLFELFNNYDVEKDKLISKIYYKEHLYSYDKDKLEISFIDYENFDCYYGYNLKGVKQGYGIYIYYIYKERYEGLWKNNKRSGKGIYYYKSKCQYEGEWYESKYHGFGKYGKFDEFYYEGQWDSGMKHGEGTFLYINGDKYIGSWKNDIREGIGTYIFQNGDVFKGIWINDLKHCFGTITYINGDKLVGEWKKDNLLDFRVYYYNSGNSRIMRKKEDIFFN